MTEPGGAEPTPGAPVPEPLSPPQPGALALAAAEPLVAVAAEQAPAMAPQVDHRQLPLLDDRVEGYLTALLKAPARSADFTRQAANVRAMGDADLRRAAETSVRLLQVPVAALEEGGLSEGSTLGRALAALRRVVEDLDPGQATAPRRLLGVIRYGDKVADYFRRFQGAQGAFGEILRHLNDAQVELTAANAALNLEKQGLWTLMGRMNAYLYVTEQLDGRLAEKVTELEPVDPARATALSHEVLLPVRRRHRDLLTQLTVLIESYLAVDVVAKNNVGLAAAAGAAGTAIETALRTALAVARASHHPLVLDVVGPVPDDAPDAADAGLPRLAATFAEVHRTLEAIDAFEADARASTGATVGVLETAVAKARGHLEPAPRPEGADEPGPEADGDRADGDGDGNGGRRSPETTTAG